MTEPNSEHPLPGLEAQPITFDQYRALTPEKLELMSGYLIAPASWRDERRRLLTALLINVGLVDTVRLAPESLWREALERAYGSASGTEADRG